MKFENDLIHLATRIKDLKFTMMSTIGEDGFIYSRPMATTKIDPENFDGKLWFFANKNSPKIKSITNDQHVNLAYTNFIQQHFVSVAGVASLSGDREKIEELWTHDLKDWFPEGLNDKDIVLICVSVHSAEIWDTPKGTFVQLFNMAKAAFTGTPIKNDPSGQIIQLD